MSDLKKIKAVIQKHEGFFWEQILECHENLAKLANLENLHDGEYGILINTFCMNVLFGYFNKTNLPHEGGLEWIRLLARDMRYAWGAHCEKN